MPILQLIPFKNELLIGLLVFILASLYTYYWYNRGFEAAQNDARIAKLEREKAELETKIKSVEATQIIVTEYRDKIVEVEKKVPVYVNTVEEIFSYDDSIVVPISLARLHDEIVCSGTSGDANPACGSNSSTERAVTLGEFSKAVVTNYSRCKANSEQLKALSFWVAEQNKIINEN